MSINAKRFAGLLLLSGFFSSSTYAADGGSLFYGAFTFGGDTLASTTESDLDAGGLFHIATGYEWRFDASGLRFTIGYKFDSVNAENGDAEISRFPLELAYYGRINERHVLGGGLVYELSPKFEISIDGEGSLNVNFDDATGLMIYYGYATSEQYEFGGRYTFIDYETGSLKVDANNFGFYANIFFD